MPPIKQFLIFSAMLVLSACSDSDIEVTATFSNTKDIKEGALVYFNDKAIGVVSDTVPYENGTRVALSLEQQAINELDNKSAVVVNHLKEGVPLEIYSRAGQIKEPLQSGQEIQGLDSMFQLGAWRVDDVIQLGSGAISDYVEAFREYLDTEQFQQGKANIEKSLGKATEAAVQAVRSVEENVAQVTEEMAVSEEELAGAVEKLGEELAPIVEGLAQGGSRLSVELERFAENLDNTSAGERESGERFLESLLATLEQLNASMEQGFQEEAIKNP